MGKEAGSSSSKFTHKKRRGGADEDVAAPSILQRVALAVSNLNRPMFTYDMRNSEERVALVKQLWTGEYESAIGAAGTANPELLALFNQQSMNSEDMAPGDVCSLRARKSMWPRFEGVMSLLFRDRSKDLVSLFVAAFSVRALHYRLPRHFWDALTQFCRVIMSRTWTEDICELALEHNPGPPYPTAGGISAAVFDNFTMKVGFGSYATTDSHGLRLDMTNWASVLLPASAMPPRFDFDTMLGNGGIFRTDRRMDDFVDLFSLSAPDIRANQQARWREYLAAATGGSLLEKPSYDSPFPPTAYVYHPPIWDRLQSSYEDVNFEVDLIRRSQYHANSDIVFLGGDGLSFMRLIHRMRQDARRYVETKPIIIPQLGEHPHGTYHVLHGDWRIWWPLLEKFAQITSNKQVQRDPTVAKFNAHEFFYLICIRACSEFVAEISATGSDYRDVPRFLQTASQNLSFAYVCNFLYLAGFKYLQMRNGVRENKSATIDLVWRENLSSARTSLANKTNYAPMSVVRVYWGWALVEPLQTLYHTLRTLRQMHTHVGWDWPIEQLNLMISNGVTANITKEQVEKFIRRLNFTHVVNRGLDRIFQANRAEKAATAKRIDNDVKLIKEDLYKCIGSTFASATAPSDANKLDLDLTDWGGDRNGQQRRNGAPWEQMAREMRDREEYVRETITRLCPWHSWAP